MPSPIANVSTVRLERLIDLCAGARADLMTLADGSSDLNVKLALSNAWQELRRAEKSMREALGMEGKR